MREVSRARGAVDSVRIAVLAALNIADECFRARAEAAEARRRAAGARRAPLARELAAALGRVAPFDSCLRRGAARL